MKFNRPKEGSTRIKERFLLFPREIDGETRWLEKAMWRERVVNYVNTFSGKDRGWGWEATQWL